MRPDIDYLLDTDFDYNCEKYVIDVMEDGWAELPEHRYTFVNVNVKAYLLKLLFLKQPTIIVHLNTT